MRNTDQSYFRVVLSAIYLAICCCPCAWSQVNKDKGQGAPISFTPISNFWANRPKQTASFLRLPGVSADYRLGAGDVVKIEVIGGKNLGQTQQISNSGKIEFPLIGSIQAEGLTAEELETELANQLQKQNLLKSPDVLVFIESYEAKPIYVIGEVDNGGEYIMSQQYTLLDAILLAGGIDFTAGRYGYLHRRIAPGGSSSLPSGNAGLNETKTRSHHPEEKTLLAYPEIALPGTEVLKVDLQPMKEGGIPADNVLLRAFDVFVVPKRSTECFYVIGDVLTAGSFEIPPGSALKASQALSWAGGPAKTARMKQGILVRIDEQGKRQEQKMDFAAVLKGRQPDFTVLPNDIIFVPGSVMKTLAYGLLGSVPGTIQGKALNSQPK